MGSAIYGWRKTVGSLKLQPAFHRPREILFPQGHLEKTPRRQDVHWQAAMPQSDAQPQFRLSLQAHLASLDSDLQDAVKGGFGDTLRVKQAQPPSLYCKFLQVSTLQPHYDGGLFGTTDGDAEFRILKFS